MPSPLAHTLTGLALGVLVTPLGDRAAAPRTRLLWAGACGLASIAPDLDFLAGALAGSVNAFHGGPSHSIAGILVFALLAGALFRPGGATRLRVAVVLGLIYASHVTLDLFSGFEHRPNALAVLWPLSDVRVTAPWHPFPGILHGAKNAGFAKFLSEVFSAHNLGALGVELLFGAPLLLGAAWLRAREAGDGRAGAVRESDAQA